MGEVRPIDRLNVTVNGSGWGGRAFTLSWSGLLFNDPETAVHEWSIWGRDYHLRVPFVHPDDPDHPDWRCYYRIRPRRKGDRFVRHKDGWALEHAAIRRGEPMREG